MIKGSHEGLIFRSNKKICLLIDSPYIMFFKYEMEKCLTMTDAFRKIKI